MKTVNGLAALALALTLSVSASADPAWLAPAPAAPLASAPQRSPWRSVAAIVAVVALGGFALYARNKRNGNLGKRSDGPTLRVLETTRLGNGGQLVVAEVNGRVMLLGVTAHNIRRIATLPATKTVVQTETKQDDIAARRATESAPTLPASTFSNALKNLLHAVPKKAQEGESAALEIAEQTSDSLEPSSERRQRSTRQEPRQLALPVNRTVEWQAAGLRRRRA